MNKLQEIIKGWLVEHSDPDYMEVLEEFIDNELGDGPYTKDTDLNLITMDKYKHILQAHYSNVEVSTGAEFRFINEDDIDRVMEAEIDEIYDVSAWRDSVQNGNTEEGYEDWLESVKKEVSYGEFFASYDGKEEWIGKWYYFRVN